MSLGFLWMCIHTFLYGFSTGLIWPKYSATHSIGPRVLVSLLPDLRVGKCPWPGAPVSGGLAKRKWWLQVPSPTWPWNPVSAATFHLLCPQLPPQAMRLNVKASETVFTLRTRFVFLQKAYKQRRGCWYILCGFKSYSENDLVFRKYFRVQQNHDLQWDAAGPRGSGRDPRLLSVTNGLGLAGAQSAGGAAASPRTTALVSSQGSSSSHQPLIPRQRTAPCLFAQRTSSLEKKCWFQGMSQKWLRRTKASLQFGLITYENVKFYFHMPKHIKY